MKARLGPSSTSQRVARGWIAVGALMVVLISAAAVGVFIFKMPVFDAHTGGLLTKAEAASSFLFIGGGGGLFLVLGLLMIRRR